MKKIFLFSILITSVISGKAQSAVSSLSENFDVSCIMSGDFPSAWDLYNPLPGSVPGGEWTCGPGEGRGGTGGILCTGTYSGAYNLDTSYLITPLLDLSSYTGRVFLRFDTKTTNIHLGGKLTIQEAPSPDSTFHVAGTHDSDITSTEFPVISSGDSSGWVTHQVELTWLEPTGTFYLAFRYTSPTTSGNTWYLDNVNTTTADLTVADVSKTTLPLKITGNATSTQITLSYTTETAGAYNLAIYDMMGRTVFKEVVNAQAGTFAYVINNLNLQPGMYLIKMGNGASYGTAKVIIP